MNRPRPLLPWEWDDARWAEARASARAYEEAVHRREAGEATSSPATAVTSTTRSTSPHVATEHAAQVRLEVAAMTSCPWRGDRVECGCNGARLCRLARGASGRVTALDCQGCPVARAELLGRLSRMLPAPAPDRA